MTFKSTHTKQICYILFIFLQSMLYAISHCIPLSYLFPLNRIPFTSSLFHIPACMYLLVHLESFALMYQIFHFFSSRIPIGIAETTSTFQTVILIWPAGTFFANTFLALCLWVVGRKSAFHFHSLGIEVKATRLLRTCTQAGTQRTKITEKVHKPLLRL